MVARLYLQFCLVAFPAMLVHADKNPVAPEIYHVDDNTYGNFVVYGNDKGHDKEMVIVIDVGTALEAHGYRLLSESILKEIPDTLVVVLDPNPWNMVKLDPKKYRESLGKMKAWFTKEKYVSIQSWYLGCHSASCEPAADLITESNTLLDGNVKGFIGLDPYNVNDGRKSVL